MDITEVCWSWGNASAVTCYENRVMADEKAIMYNLQLHIEGMHQILGYKAECDGNVTTLSRVNLLVTIWNYSYIKWPR